MEYRRRKLFPSQSGFGSKEIWATLTLKKRTSGFGSKEISEIWATLPLNKRSEEWHFDSSWALIIGLGV